MFKLQITSLAELHTKDREEAYRSRGGNRQIKVAELAESLLQRCLQMGDVMEYHINRVEERADKNLDKVQNNLLEAHATITDLKCEMVALKLKLSQLESVNDTNDRTI